MSGKHAVGGLKIWTSPVDNPASFSKTHSRSIPGFIIGLRRVRGDPLLGLRTPSSELDSVLKGLWTVTSGHRIILSGATLAASGSMSISAQLGKLRMFVLVGECVTLRAAGAIRGAVEQVCRPHDEPRDQLVTQGSERVSMDCVSDTLGFGPVETPRCECAFDSRVRWCRCELPAFGCGRVLRHSRDTTNSMIA